MLLKSCSTLLLVLFFCYHCMAQTEQNTVYKTDSTLRAYFKRCKANMDSPLVLSMCDTLLQRSEESGDKHMQIISYCLKLDYFYYKNDEENILRQTDEVKKACLRLDNLKT